VHQRWRQTHISRAAPYPVLHILHARRPRVPGNVSGGARFSRRNPHVDAHAPILFFPAREHPHAGHDLLRFHVWMCSTSMSHLICWYIASIVHGNSKCVSLSPFPCVSVCLRQNRCSCRVPGPLPVLLLFGVLSVRRATAASPLASSLYSAKLFWLQQNIAYRRVRGEYSTVEYKTCSASYNNNN
jgi:hypothetical protein